MANVWTSLNNIKTKVDDLDGGKLKTVHVDLKKLSDAVDNEVLKNTKFHTLKTTTFIQINQIDKFRAKKWRCWEQDTRY